MDQRGNERDSRGFVLVWTAILLTLLLLMAALAVDLGFWYKNKNQAQQAADAAAAAGVIYRSVSGSDDWDGAVAAAKAAALRNGFSDSEVLVSKNNEDVSPPKALPANQLYVRITRRSPNFFLSIIGMDATTVSASSTAEYEAPLAIGSPCSELGHSPGPDWTEDTPCSGAEGTSLWLDIHGHQTPTVYGDRYSAWNCAPVAGITAQACSGGVNRDKSVDGYTYILRVLKGGEGVPVTVQAYDPAFGNTGPQCDSTAAKSLYNLIGKYNVDRQRAYVQNELSLYNAQVAPHQLHIDQLRARITVLENQILSMQSTKTAAQNRLDFLIGAGGSIASPKPGSELAKLRAGIYGPRTSWFPSAAYKREWEITHALSSGYPSILWVFNGLSLWDGLWNFEQQGTYFYDNTLAPVLMTETLPFITLPGSHGDSPSTVSSPIPPLWNNQHDSAVETQALIARINTAISNRNAFIAQMNSEIAAEQSIINGIPYPEAPIPVDRSRYIPGPYSPVSIRTDGDYCSGDTGFGGTYYTDDPPWGGGGGGGCIGFSCTIGGTRDLQQRPDLERTDAGTSIRPVTNFVVSSPAGIAPGEICNETYGGFIERRNNPFEPSPNNSRDAEFFRAFAWNMNLEFKFGMDDSFLAWAGLLPNYADPGPGAPQQTDGYGHRFVDTFHQWNTLCTFTPLVAGDYTIRVNTNTAPTSAGANRFSLRASQPGPASATSGKFVRVFGKDRMNLLLSFPDPTSSSNEVYMTRVLPAGYDRTLELTLHDPGDVRYCETVPSNAQPRTCALTGQLASTPSGYSIDATTKSTTISLTRVDPTAPPTNTTPISSCSYAIGANPSSWTTVSPCVLSNLQGAGPSGTNGALLTIRIPLRSSSEAGGYLCNPTDIGDLGCWIKANYSFDLPPVDSEGHLTTLFSEDVTTWNAEIKGDPLRFVNN